VATILMTFLRINWKNLVGGLPLGGRPGARGPAGPTLNPALAKHTFASCAKNY